MDTLSLIIGILIGALGGGAAVWFALSARSRAEQKSLADANTRLQADLTSARAEAGQLNSRVTQLTGDLATANANLVHSEKRQQEVAQQIEQMQANNRTEFENIANRVLDDKTAKFTTQNQTNLTQLLDPLRQQIGEFKEKVEAVHTDDKLDRASLLFQIKSLKELNAQVTEDAKNLTLALKGDSKVQGDWGEMILERVLERSGLTKGVEFSVQENLKTDTGANVRPDVIINLPDKKHFVVDSKVSLTAYERYCSAQDPEERERALKQHAQSLRAHVQELANSSYESLYQITTPDFVFMFIPIEPALGVALQADSAIFNDAFDKKVILVTPSTLLVTLRTVEQIWKQEKQTRNALDIARKSGLLYDKFEGLYRDLLKVGDKLKEASAVHQEALDKLKTGRGNLFGKVEELKKLGAKAQKSLPDGVLEEAAEGGSEDEESAKVGNGSQPE
jgi:DNA recombination protein RmuC